MITKIKKLIGNLRKSRQVEREAAAAQKLIDSHLAGLSGNDIHDMKAVLQNQLQYMKTRAKTFEMKCKCGELVGSRPTISLEESLLAAKRMMLALNTLRPLVGIQPLTGPIGNIYSLQHKVHSGGTDKVSLEVLRETAEARSRKLSAAWSTEAASDMRTAHGANIVAELSNMLGQDIAQECIREIIGDIRTIAGTYEFSKNDPKLLVRVNAIANDIAAETRRACGNILVATPSTCAMLMNSKDIKFEPCDFTKSNIGFGLTKLGTFNSIDVYTYLYMPDDELILAYKGQSGDTDTAYTICPYIPVGVGSVAVDPETWDASLPLYTRYGKWVMEKREDSICDASSYYKLIKLVE